MRVLRIWHKVAFLFIFVVIILVFFETSTPVLAETPIIIAAWDYTEAPTDYPVKATSGFLGAKAFLEDFKISYKTPGYLNDGLSLRGWDKGAGTKFWQVSFPTKAYRNLSISAKTSSSPAGPRDFKIIYSIDDGVTWNEVPGSLYQITDYTKAGQDVVYKHDINLSLPVEADNRDKLLLRFIMRSNFPAQTYFEYNYGNVASDGTSQINNIIVSGTPMVTGIVLNTSEETIKKEETLMLTALIEPENAGNKQVEWTTSDSQIAKVEDGVVKGVGPGTAIITAKTAEGGFQASCKITVEVPVTGITFERANETLIVGSKLQLTPKIDPINATNKDVLWESSNKQIADVDMEGNITALSYGTAEITAKTIDGGFKASCTIAVIIPVTGIQTEDEYVTVNPGGSIQLNAVILPENATNKNVIWESSDTSIAAVDDCGRVKGIKIGVAKITATTVDGNFNAEYTVAIAEKPVTGIRLNKEEVTIEAGKFEMVNAHLLQGNVSVSDLIWSSSDESIVNIENVRDNGKTVQILGLAQGEAIITVRSLDGGFTATCRAIVIPSKKSKK